MNGSNRLYRSTSEAMIGGVAAGVGNYFKVDPTFVRLGFAAATFFTSGAFLLVYLAMWLLVPTVGSTATEPGKILNENLNQISEKFRGFSGAGQTNSPANSAAGGTPTTNISQEVPHSQTQLPQGSTTVQHHRGFNPKVLILIGGFFLLMNMGAFRAFHGIHMGFFWPVILIGIGVMMLSRRRP